MELEMSNHTALDTIKQTKVHSIAWDHKRNGEHKSSSQSSLLSASATHKPPLLDLDLGRTQCIFQKGSHQRKDRSTFPSLDKNEKMLNQTKGRFLKPKKVKRKPSLQAPPTILSASSLPPSTKTTEQQKGIKFSKRSEKAKAQRRRRRKQKRKREEEERLRKREIPPPLSDCKSDEVSIGSSERDPIMAISNKRDGSTQKGATEHGPVAYIDMTCGEEEEEEEEEDDDDRVDKRVKEKTKSHGSAVQKSSAEIDLSTSQIVAIDHGMVDRRNRCINRKIVEGHFEKPTDTGCDPVETSSAPSLYSRRDTHSPDTSVESPANLPGAELNNGRMKLLELIAGEWRKEAPGWDPPV